MLSKFLPLLNKKGATQSTSYEQKNWVIGTGE